MRRTSNFIIKGLVCGAVIIFGFVANAQADGLKTIVNLDNQTGQKFYVKTENPIPEEAKSSSTSKEKNKEVESSQFPQYVQPHSTIQLVAEGEGESLDFRFSLLVADVEQATIKFVLHKDPTKGQDLIEINNSSHQFDVIEVLRRVSKKSVTGERVLTTTIAIRERNASPTKHRGSGSSSSPTTAQLTETFSSKHFQVPSIVDLSRPTQDVVQDASGLVRVRKSRSMPRRSSEIFEQDASGEDTASGVNSESPPNFEPQEVDPKTNNEFSQPSNIRNRILAFENRSATSSAEVSKEDMNRGAPRETAKIAELIKKATVISYKVGAESPTVFSTAASSDPPKRGESEKSRVKQHVRNNKSIAKMFADEIAALKGRKWDESKSSIDVNSSSSKSVNDVVPRDSSSNSPQTELVTINNDTNLQSKPKVHPNQVQLVAYVQITNKTKRDLELVGSACLLDLEEGSIITNTEENNDESNAEESSQRVRLVHYGGHPDFPTTPGLPEFVKAGSVIKIEAIGQSFSSCEALSMNIVLDQDDRIKINFRLTRTGRFSSGREFTVSDSGKTVSYLDHKPKVSCTYLNTQPRFGATYGMGCVTIQEVDK